MRVGELIKQNEIGNCSRLWISEFQTHGSMKRSSNNTPPVMVEVAGDRLIKISAKTGGYLSGRIYAKYCQYEGFFTEQEAIDYYNGRIKSCITSAESKFNAYKASLEKHLIGGE